jgi:hypothetical protein
MQTSDVQEKFLIIVEDNAETRQKYKTCLAAHPVVTYYMTDSIFNATVQYMLWMAKGIMPRAIVADWDVQDGEACYLDERDNCHKSGAHFLLSRCADDNNGLLVAYTSDPRSAQRRLVQSLEGPRVQVVSKDLLGVDDLMTWVINHKSFNMALSC